MRRLFTGVMCVLLVLQCAMTAFGAVPEGTGVIKSAGAVSGSEFTSKSSIAKKLDKMFAGDIGLYKDKEKTVLVDAALGTKNVPNNGVYQYWADGHSGTSCFAYANAFYATFYDGFSPHDKLNGNHQRVKATGKITYQNFVKWGVRDDAVVYIREGTHSFLVLHYDENYLITIDGNGDGKGLIAIRKQTWQKSSGSNIYNQKPSLIVQPKTSYFASGSMGMKAPKRCTEGGEYHSWDDGVVTKQPSCKETGEKIYTCEDCGKTNPETLSKTSGHTYGQWSVSQEATCAKKGTKVQTCTVCGKEKTQSISALGHDYAEEKIVRKMTLSTPGLIERTCTRCAKVQKKEIPCATEDKTVGISLKIPKGAFSKNTALTMVRLAPEEGAYEAIENALENITGKFAAYRISADIDGVPAQPEKPLQMKLTIPEEFGENLALYALDADGTVRSLEITPAKNGKTLTCTLENLSEYALCDLDVPWVPKPTEATEATEATEVTEVTVQPVTEIATEQLPEIAEQKPEETGQENSYILLIAIAVTVLLAGCMTVLVILETKKRKKEQAASLPTDD